MKDSELAWQPQGSKNIFSTRIFDIHELTSRSPENTDCTFYTLHATDWVIVVPVTENADGEKCFLLVRQWRHGAGKMSLEFPGGVMDAGETPAESAARELLEETGFRAGTLTAASSISPNPAIMDNTCHIFFAENLTNTHELDLDDDEFVSAIAVPVAEVIKKMGHGEYLHALMSTALFLWIQKNGLPG
jgi:ADP-ribose pyrophosphatase